jgi:hypothetical protein
LPFNGSGIFGLAAGNPVITGTTISSSWANNTLGDISANGLTNCLTKDGQQTPIANIPLGGFRITNLGNGTALTDAANLSQIQNSTSTVLSSISGTGDAIIAGSAPAITAYTAGQEFTYTPTSTNTLTNPTINISSVGAKTITQSNGLGLWSGALAVGTPYQLYYDGTNFRVQTGQLAQGIPYYQSRTSHRNYIADGNFDFWRSGTSFTIASGLFQFTADMWIVSSGGGSSSLTISKTNFTAGGTPVGMTTPANSFLKASQTVAATVTGSGISQHIPGVRTLENHTATYGVWLWTDSGTITITSLSTTQNFGAGGSAGVTTNTTVNWVITTTPTFFSASLAIPSISGKTIGTDFSDNLSVRLNLPVSVTFALNMAQVQLEESPPNAPAAGLPTPFEYRGADAELGRVNRSVQNLTDPVAFPQEVIGTGVFTSATNFQALIPLAAPMRLQPVLTFVSGTAAAFVAVAGSSFAISAMSLVTASSSTTGLLVNCTVAGATTGQAGILRLSTSALLIADARV